MSSATVTRRSDASDAARSAEMTLPSTSSTSTSRSYEQARGRSGASPRSGERGARAAKKARKRACRRSHYPVSRAGASNTTRARIDSRSVMVLAGRARRRPERAGDVAHDGERLPESFRRVGPPGHDRVGQRDRRVELAAGDEGAGIADAGERGGCEHDSEPPRDRQEQVPRVGSSGLANPGEAVTGPLEQREPAVVRREARRLREDDEDLLLQVGRSEHGMLRQRMTGREEGDQPLARKERLLLQG